MPSFNLFKSRKKKGFTNAYSWVNENQTILSVAFAFSQILKSQHDKQKLLTAYTDKKIFHLSENFMDLGLIYHNPLHAFFGGNPNDHGHPYNPLSDLSKFQVDVILGPEGIDLAFFTKSIKEALENIKFSYFKTCLNPTKILLIAAFVCLIPDNSTIIEVGSYQCGTTIFMAQLCQVLNKQIKIYAFDTYQGMPEALEQDRHDPIVFDSGLFNDNLIENVWARIKEMKLENYIELVKGDVVKTLADFASDNISLVFLDTDQYKGTKSGLNRMAELKSNPHIIIDDVSLHGVNLAIEEFLGNNKSYARKNLYYNFDYLAPRSAK